MKQIRGLILDIENVFFDGTYWHRQLRQLLANLGRQLDFRTIRSDWQNEFLPRVYSGELQYWDAWATYFARLGFEGCEIRELLASARSKLLVAQSKLRPLPGAVEAIARIHSIGLRLAILCNSIHSSVELGDLLKRIGFATSFDPILTSRAAGRVLPDGPALYQVSKQLDLSCDRIGYLSGDLQRLEFAAEKGMFAIHASGEWALHLKVATSENATPPDATTSIGVRQLSELLCRRLTAA